MVDMTKVRIRRLHRWSIAIRYRLSQQEVEAFTQNPDGPVEVTEHMMMEVFGPACVDCHLGPGAAPDPKYCEAPEPLD